MKKKLLFATYYDEHPDEGLSYVLDLAKALNEDLTIFLFHKETISKKLDDLMTAVTFAEANEHETAIQAIAKAPEKINDGNDEKIALLVGKCRKSGINVDLHSFKTDVVPSIESYFKHRNGIDMILLSPNVTGNGNVTTRGLKKLLTSVSRPIVTIARQHIQSADENDEKKGGI